MFQSAETLPDVRLPVDRAFEEPAQISPQPRRGGASKGHQPVIDALRGIAALAVCWFHYTNAQFSEQFSAYSRTGRYGWLGVQVFFVISGFIIPYSMYRANYRPRSFFRFLAKRILRLDPPYLASIVIVLLGLYLSSFRHAGPHYQVPWRQVLGHLGYANAFLGMPWLQMTYWSLAVEFQYYLFIGLLFPLLMRRDRASVAALYTLFGVLGLLCAHNSNVLFYYLPVFLIGIVVFRFKSLNTTPVELATGLAVATGLALYLDGMPQAAVGLATGLVILLINASTPLLSFLGKISYSIYLIHVFVGQIVFGLAVHHPEHLALLKWILPPATVGLAIAAAYLLYLSVEMPSKWLSSKIRY